MRNQNRLLARAILFFVLLQLLPAAAFAGDQEFHSLVDRMSAYCQKRPMPFMGLLSFMGNRFTPHGVGHLQMAIFEDIPSLRTRAGEELEPTLQGLVGPDYQAFVRVQDRRSGDLTLIYVRESGKKSFEMLVVSIESAEAVLVKMQLNPDAMRDWMDEPVSSGRDSARGRRIAGER